MKTDARLQHDRDVLLKRIHEMEHTIETLSGDLTKAGHLATIGMMTGMVVHEFNNLLAHMSGYAQLAQNTPNDPALVSKALARTVEGTDLLTRIAAAILDFMHDDEQLQTVDLNQALTETLQCLPRHPQKDGVQLNYTITANLRVVIRPICMQQVLLNLIMNSIQAMQPGGGRLTINAQSDRENEEWIVLTLSDTGRGIPVEVAKKAFKPLLNGSPDNLKQCLKTAVSDRSHGLGLSICHHLVEEAGGQIEFQSKKDVGTTFTIRLRKAPLDVSNPDESKNA